MPTISTEQILAALACAYVCYRLISALRTGVYDGDGDLDVHAAKNPGAFVLTVASGALVAILLAVLVFSSGGSATRIDPTGSQGFKSAQP